MLLVQQGRPLRGDLDRPDVARAVRSLRSGRGRWEGARPFHMQSPRRPSRKPQFRLYAYRSHDLWRTAELLWPFLSDAKRKQIERIACQTSGRLSPSHPRMHPGDRYELLLGRIGLAWAAGFFDGEGCFSYSPASRYACVSITQQYPDVLHRFRRIVGVGKTYGPYRHPPGRTLSDKPFYLYRAHGYKFVQAIAAMLWFKLGSAKRAQAAAVLAMWPRTCQQGHILLRGHSGCGHCVRQYWNRYREVKRQGG
jgi:hypothetical protein